MKKTLKWVKRILGTLLALILVVMLALWVSFYFWKKDVVNNLPKDSQVLTTDKGPIEYSLTGNSDKYMLMIHGSPGSVHVAGGQYFIEKGFSVLAISRPGYYQTPLSSGKTAKEQSALYKSLLDELKIDSVYINGISGGGPSSIAFAIDYPERCAGLILRAAVSEKIDETNDDKSLVQSFFETEFGTWLGIQIATTQMSEEEKEKINWFIRGGFFPFEYIAEGYDNDVHHFAVLKDFQLEKITTPTIVFHGDKDKNVPFSFSQDVAQRIPNATFFEMKGKDHYDFFLSYGNTVNTEIVQFVNSLEE